MSFSRFWPFGIGDGVKVLGAALTQLDLFISRAIDGFAGGKCQPSAKVQIAGAGLEVGDVNEPARFSTANAKWLGAATDFITLPLNVAGVMQDVTASFDRGGLLVAADSSSGSQIYRSLDDGTSWEQQTLGGGITLRCCTSSPGRMIVAGDSATAIYSVDDFATPAATFVFPGTPTAIGALHYDTFNGRYIAVGKTAGAPYLATATLASPPVATQRTVPASITGSNAGVSIAQNPVTGRLVASWAGQTKVAFSSDGITWTASTTSLASGSYIVRFGDGVFIAIDMVAPSSNYYISTDGDTWTQVGITSPTPFGLTSSKTFDCLNGIFAVASTAAYIAFSADKGATWAVESVSNLDTPNPACKVLRAKNRRFYIATEAVTTGFFHRSRKLGIISGSG